MTKEEAIIKLIKKNYKEGTKFISALHYDSNSEYDCAVFESSRLTYMRHAGALIRNGGVNYYLYYVDGNFFAREYVLVDGEKVEKFGRKILVEKFFLGLKYKP